MKHALIFLGGLALAYFALRFGDELQLLELWIHYVVLVIGSVTVGSAIAFFIVNNTVVRNNSRFIGFSNAGLFWVMLAVITGAFAYGAIVQPVFHQWGLEPWNWIGKGDAWENLALYAIGFLVALVLQHFWIASVAYMRSRHKKSGAYVEEQKSIYKAIENLRYEVHTLGGVLNECLKTIQSHNQVGGKVTHLKDVMLPQLFGAIYYLTDMVNKRLPPLAEEVRQSKPYTQSMVEQPKETNDQTTFPISS